MSLRTTKSFAEMLISVFVLSQESDVPVPFLSSQDYKVKS